MLLQCIKSSQPLRFKHHFCLRESFRCPSVNALIMVVCLGCGAQCAYLPKRGYCCGHCMDNRGHGRNCPVRAAAFRSLEEVRWLGSLGLGPPPPPLSASGRHRDRDRSRSRPVRNRIWCAFEEATAVSMDDAASWVVRTGGDQRATATVEDTSAASSSAGNDVTPHCVVCMERPCTHACLPCGHRKLCQTCAADDSMHRLDWQCPECRQSVQMVTRIYI